MDDSVLDELLSAQSLQSAQRRALRGKRENHFASRSNYYVISEITALQSEIANGTYKPREYRRKTIYEPKERKIEAPAFFDRILHHALHRYLNVHYEKRFIHASFACREGRGTHRASHYVQKTLRTSQKLYVCQLDISKYYASINHSKLRQILARQITGTKFMALLEAIIASTDSGDEHDYLFASNNYFHTKGRRGIPIGNLTSQLFANVYLHEADMYAKQHLKIRHYVRYMDDILFFHTDKKQLLHLQHKMTTFLYEELYLTVNPRKVRIYKASQGVEFVGYHIRPFYMRLRGRSLRRFKRKFNRKLKKLLRGEISLEDFDASFNAWKGHAMHANGGKLVKSLERKRMIYLATRDARSISD